MEAVKLVATAFSQLSGTVFPGLSSRFGSASLNDQQLNLQFQIVSERNIHWSPENRFPYFKAWWIKVIKKIFVFALKYKLLSSFPPAIAIGSFSSGEEVDVTLLMARIVSVVSRVFSGFFKKTKVQLTRRFPERRVLERFYVPAFSHSFLKIINCIRQSKIFTTCLLARS